jgi:hypothetical protein
MRVAEHTKHEHNRLLHDMRNTHDTTEGADDDYDEDPLPQRHPERRPCLMSSGGNSSPIWSRR